MNDITLLKTMKDVFDTLNRKYPTWIISIHDEYSDDYKFLTENWIQICDKAKVNRQKIILVTHFEENSEHLAFAELLTQVGFCVRAIHDFISCSSCNKVLPTFQTHSIFMKSKYKEHYSFPKEWQSTCLACSASSSLP